MFLTKSFEPLVAYLFVNHNQLEKQPLDEPIKYEKCFANSYQKQKYEHNLKNTNPMEVNPIALESL